MIIVIIVNRAVFKVYYDYFILTNHKILRIVLVNSERIFIFEIANQK